MGCKSTIKQLNAAYNEIAKIRLLWISLCINFTLEGKKQVNFSA